MTEFPPTDDTVELVHHVVGKNVPIYCTCRLPNNNAAYMSSVVDAASGTIQILLISLNLHSIQQQNGCALNATRKHKHLNSCDIKTTLPDVSKNLYPFYGR